MNVLWGDGHNSEKDMLGQGSLIRHIGSKTHEGIGIFDGAVVKASLQHLTTPVDESVLACCLFVS